MMKTKFFPALIIMIALSPLVFLYNNCGNVSLKAIKGEETPASTSGDVISTLKLPVTPPGQMRFAFFVDMSVSMAHGLCPEDVGADSTDKNLAGADAAECSSYAIRKNKGVDPAMNRLNVISQWISQVEANNPNARYLIVPFSGGAPIEVNRAEDGDMNFTNAATARAFVTKLKTQQADFYDAYVGTTPTEIAGTTKLGTSSPPDRLQVLQTKIAGEIGAYANDRLTFEVVLLSDGVPKAQSKHLKMGIRKIWAMVPYFSQCATKCGFIADSYIDSISLTGTFGSKPYCGYFDQGGTQTTNDCFNSQIRWGNGNGTTYSIPDMNPLMLIEQMGKIWGERYQLNTPHRIALKINEVKTLLENKSSLQSRISMVWLDNPMAVPPPIAPENQVIENNWMLKTHDLKIDHRFVTWNGGANPPFALGNIGSDIESYQIGAFYMINPALRVGAKGEPIVDSDADGVSDGEEARYNTDPAHGIKLDSTKPRSNGKCLDVLTVNGLCPSTLICNSVQDSDGDGLNECEEMILGTSATQFDSDGDAVPDSLELLIGSDPLASDAGLDWSGDQVSNLDQIKAGVHPQAAFSKVPANLKILCQVSLIEFTNAEVNSPRLGRYRVRVDHFPTLPVSDSKGSILYYSPIASAGQEVPNPLIGFAHASSQTPVVVLVRVDNKQHSGDVQWGFIVKMISSVNPEPITIQVKDLTYFKTLDPRGGQW